MNATNSTKERTYGLMFKPEMILAYLAGDKTQTRRIKGLKKINQAPDEWKLINQAQGAGFASFCRTDANDVFQHIRFPHGRMHETLYFKETWRAWEDPKTGEDFLRYRADNMIISPMKFGWRNDVPYDFDYLGGRFSKWQSSMFMPMKCSRFREITIVDVRAERLLSITEADAKAEGMKVDSPKGIIHFSSCREKYLELWEKINPDLPAKINPWVFVYEFPKYDNRHIDEKVLDSIGER